MSLSSLCCDRRELSESRQYVHVDFPGIDGVNEITPTQTPVDIAINNENQMFK
jgi:hypothetical protein